MKFGFRSRKAPSLAATPYARNVDDLRDLICHVMWGEFSPLKGVSDLAIIDVAIDIAKMIRYEYELTPRAEAVKAAEHPRTRNPNWPSCK